MGTNIVTKPSTIDEQLLNAIIWSTVFFDMMVNFNVPSNLSSLSEYAAKIVEYLHNYYYNLLI